MISSLEYKQEEKAGSGQQHMIYSHHIRRQTKIRDGRIYIHIYLQTGYIRSYDSKINDPGKGF